jgi:hypothetical protein
MLRPSLLLVLLIVAVAGCAETPPTMPPIEFLTRSGCIQTKNMRARLDAAIQALGKPMPYTVVDLDTLPATDVRKAYPTPTVLVGSVDMFGMEEPKPPYPEPT